MIKIAKVVINQIQIDIHNMKENIDIMRSCSCNKTPNSASVCIKTPYPCSPTNEDVIITKMIGIYKSLHRVKPPYG